MPAEAGIKKTLIFLGSRPRPREGKLCAGTTITWLFGASSGALASSHLYAEAVPCRNPFFEIHAGHASHYWLLRGVTSVTDRE